MNSSETWRNPAFLASFLFTSNIQTLLQGGNDILEAGCYEHVFPQTVPLFGQFSVAVFSSPRYNGEGSGNWEP